MHGSSSPTAILFTDIEGSTRLWEQQPERMSQALKQHDVSARAAVERNRGIVVKMVGDGVYAAFDDPLDGLNATLDLQQSLCDPATTHGIPLHVRCGLHLGVVERRDNDLFGPPVNRTARLMSAAHGGQILLSEAFAGALDGRLPPEVTLRDLGGVRLKDLSAPEHVFQILHPRLRQDFPALRSLEASPNNLPQQLTTFIGREQELKAAAELLRNARLVTLLGMGGLGKTRLSLQIAADALDTYPDGVWFVDLAPIRDASLVPSVVATTLSVQEEAGRPLIQTLRGHLKSRKTLIILDNCEHLIDACASIANALLQAAPQLRMIATSREALRVPGEQVYQVSPMPAPDRSAGVEALLRSDAVRLFVDRARLHKATFELVEAEAPAVAELCTRLEGIPLAIELAAARMRTLSVADINTRLRDRFKLLTGGGRVLLERQQTLRALVDWSYDLLSAGEQVLFDRLCVFAGGFDVASAEAVCGVEPLAGDDVLDLLTSLVDKSLVTLDETAADSRYRTLETIRDYAREKLQARGEADAIAVRHCDYFLTMAKAANKGMKGPEQPQWIGRAEAELDNLRAAIALALEGRVDPVLAVKLVVALQSFWLLRGYCTEARGYVRAALAKAPVTASDVAHAHALYVGAALAAGQGDHAEALRMLEACLELRLRIGVPVDIAATLSTLSLVRLRIGDAAKARESEQEALRLFREIGEPIGEAIGLLHLGQIALDVAQDDEAQRYFEACLAIAKRTRHREIESECERMLGEIALDNGRVDAARARFQRSLDLCREAGDRRDEATSLWWLARADLACDEVEQAGERLATALKAFRAFEMNEEMLGCLEDHARLAQRLGRAEQAARLFGAVVAQRERLALKAAPRLERALNEAMGAARADIGDAPFETAAAQGALWELDEAIRRAAASENAALALA
jgi:predicted ATPase/class 3 adenylate cyclase